ncbi:MAG: type II secretion system protein [Bdellovibrionales bacterium]|nr:type II secretion system protein [Bdellovibrionales bacterium]
MIKTKKAFSLLELLTALAIIMTLVAIAVTNYQKSVNKTKMKEAKTSLSYIYSSQLSFHNSWLGYHENLVSIGAIPSGPYIYDVGFGKEATLKSNYGKLDNYPLVNSKDVINTKACTNFFQICNGECFSAVQSNVGNPYTGFFSNRNTCSVKTNCTLHDFQGFCNVGLSSDVKSKITQSEAKENSFTAVAITEMNSLDVWSINEDGILTHENDGSE